MVTAETRPLMLDPSSSCSIATVYAPCALCGSADAEPRWTTRDRIAAVPGTYTVAQCQSCSFLYQRPRVSDAQLADCYRITIPATWSRRRECRSGVRMRVSVPFAGL